MAIALDPFSNLLWNIGYAFCHQLPERSFFYSGFQMPVCARDMGTYLGFLVVFLYWYLLRRYHNGSKPDAIVLAFAAVGMLPFFGDGFASYLGFYSTNNVIRLATGLLMGACMGLILLSVFPQMVVARTSSRKVFMWKDLIPICAAITIIGVLAISLDLGIVMFYVLETLTISGILILLFMAISTLMLFALKGTRFKMAMSRSMLFAYAFVLEAVLISILWFLHHVIFALID